MNRDPREVIREEPLHRGQLLGFLADRPMTVPELAAAADEPVEEVLLWIMGMRRYGHVAEQGSPDADGYFSYAAARS